MRAPDGPRGTRGLLQVGGIAETETQRAFRKVGESVADLREAFLETAPGRGIIRLLDRLEDLLSRWWR